VQPQRMSEEDSALPIVANDGVQASHLLYVAGDGWPVRPDEDVGHVRCPQQPAFEWELLAGCERCDVKRQAPVERPVKAPVVPASEAVGTRFGAVRVLFGEFVKVREEGALGPTVTLSRPGDPSEGVACCVSSAWGGQLAPLLGRGRCCGCSTADSSGSPRLLVKGQFRALHDRHLFPRLQLSKGSWSDANALGLTRGRLARASRATARRGSPKTSTSTSTATSSTASTTQRVPVRSGIAPDSANSVTPPVRSLPTRKSAHQAADYRSKALCHCTPSLPGAT
jgi:hypothetical protein